MAVDFVSAIELRKAIEQLHPGGHLFEVRVIGSNRPLSGYFRDADTLIRALHKVDLRNANVYVTLNDIDDALFSRQQCEKFLPAKQTTNDKDVQGYRYLFIDLDPKRPAGISSSREEVQEAIDLAGKVYSYLKDMGFEEPVRAISGNGAHLLYSIGLVNSDANMRLVERCLKALSLMFDTDKVGVDTANFNASRICKLYGTLAQKGANTAERPHRMSKIYGEVKELKQTDRAYLERLAEQLPEAEPLKAEAYNNYSPNDFDIESWMREHFISYEVKAWRDGCTKYVLAHCPFNHDHKAPDSSIIKQSNGAIGFKCLHNSCQGKTWRDVRLMFEPDAYDNKGNRDAEIEAGYQAMKHNRDREIDYSVPTMEEATDKRPVFSTARMILDTPGPDEEFILTGIDKLDKASRGLLKGGLSIVSGLRGASKSTWLSEVSLNAVDDGHNVVVFSGELTNKNYMRWLFQQAAGKRHVKPSDKWQGFYYTPREVQEKVADWLGDKYWLYNNDYGNNYVNLKKSLLEIIAKTRADLVILDNLMAMDISALNKDKYEAQSAFVNDLAGMAKLANVHIMFVAHPRKAQGFLRLDDVAGAGDLTNAVDQAFIVHRNNMDFKRLSAQMFGWKEDNEAYKGSNVIEIAKDRQSGVQDLFIPLWYEAESKRLKNTDYEMRVYGWDEESHDGFLTINEYQGELPF